MILWMCGVMKKLQWVNDQAFFVLEEFQQIHHFLQSENHSPPPLSPIYVYNCFWIQLY